MGFSTGVISQQHGNILYCTGGREGNKGHALLDLCIQGVSILLERLLHASLGEKNMLSPF